MPEGALAAILRSTGLSGQGPNTVSFTGGADPLLPTPFRIAAAGAAAIAAAGLAAAGLWEQRTGRPQTVSVDLRHATASLRSGLYMRLGGGPLPDERNPIMGVYPTRDGRWAYIHSNFPNHFAAALKVLRCDGTREGVARALTCWDALEFEEALIAAGSMVRTQAEWAEHPQSLAVAMLPLLDIIRIGDSPPEPLRAGMRPLSGTRVLAEHGADVLKVTGPHVPHLGYQEPDTGHGKLSASLD